MKSIDELKELNDDQLFNYFIEHSGFYPQNPEDSQYSIRVGSRALFSDDTADLREQFFKKVREQK